jgi:hypothetical protein
VRFFARRRTSETALNHSLGIADFSGPGMDSDGSEVGRAYR